MKLVRVLMPIAVLGFNSCTHITLMGHKSAYDLNAEFAGDPIAPVSMNAGFEGTSFAAVPPKEAVHWLNNLKPSRLPEKDVMSTVMKLKVEKIASNNVTGNIPFDFVTSGATGLAANALVGETAQENEMLEEVGASAQKKKGIEQAKKVGDRINNITDSSSSIPL